MGRPYASTAVGGYDPKPGGRKPALERGAGDEVLESWKFPSIMLPLLGCGW
jgi:hypothetical protein